MFDYNDLWSSVEFVIFALEERPIQRSRAMRFGELQSDRIPIAVPLITQLSHSRVSRVIESTSVAKDLGLKAIYSQN